MTNKLCNAHCLYSIDGRCRLENRGGILKVSCAHYDPYFKLDHHRII